MFFAISTLDSIKIVLDKERSRLRIFELDIFVLNHDRNLHRSILILIHQKMKILELYLILGKLIHKKLILIDLYKS